jgi:indole-3-glycerol phosphate synthase
VSASPRQRNRNDRRSLAEALRSGSPGIIAEIKKASPSRGILKSDLDPIELAKSYEQGGAAAISVVTEPEFFRGEGAWVASVREATALPILRKDFIVDPVQVAESAVLGADAILLIARILSPGKIKELALNAAEFGLEVLFEVHDEADLARVLALTPSLVGVNARNLDDFTVDTGLFRQLRQELPAGAIAIAESGIESRDQIIEFSEAGYDAFLIGESLVTSPDPLRLLRELRGVADG